MSATPDPTTAIRKTRSVPLPPDAAFELFTTRMGAWWPLDSHALSDTASDVRWDDHVGRARSWNSTTDGNEFPWAEITVWDPPRRLALAWHLRPGAVDGNHRRRAVRTRRRRLHRAPRARRVGEHG